jgi:hypothetical protein
LFVNIFLLLCISGGFTETKDTIRRFAIVIGANDGGPKRTKLQYAVSDANSMLKVLHEMGGVLPEDSLLLVEPDRKNFLSSIKNFKDKINKSKSSSKRVEAIFYYSGHSDEEAILLGKEKISYKDIKDYIDSLPVDVRIAILDSCSSGAFTRIKGGKMRTPFLVDTSYSMKGYAFMTSSSMDEASQESDRIRGSFFTHYLVSGLRGAADMTQDGRITLTEAYQYAYSETLAGTEKSLSGPQHPNYNIQMSGMGDVVMTDIRKSSAIMILSEDLSGRLFIRDKNDNLVCELKKPAGRTMQFGLEHGSYTIINIKDGNLYKAEVSLIYGNQILLGQNNFVQSGKEPTKKRGDMQVEKEQDENYIIEPWNFSVVPLPARNADKIHYYSFNLFGSYSGKLDGFDVGFGPSIIGNDMRGMQLSLIGTYAGGKTEGLQFSYFGNISRKDLSGLQLSNIFNYSGNSVSGVQITGIFNNAGKNMKGVQLSGIFNYAGEEMLYSQIGGIGNYARTNAKGAQISGLFNIAGEKVTGTQLSGLFNYGGISVNGLQATGLFNIAGKKMSGAQISCIFNYSDEDVKGIQLAGIANIAGNIYGSQISLLNIANDFNGVQIGLINISKTQNGIPIGLINISKNGSIDIAVWESSLMATNFGVIIRSNYIYTVISAGWYNQHKDIQNSTAFGFHFGVHIPIKSFYINIDAGAIYIDNEDFFSDKRNRDENALQCRLAVGYNITDRIAIFAGGGANYIYDIETGDDAKSRFKDGKFVGLYFAGVKYSIYNGN